MERSVKTIGKTKWCSLSHRQKHTAFARFAVICIENKEPDEFLKYYNILLSWSPVDRYIPPIWLTPFEALNLYFLFHQMLSDKPISYFKKEKSIQADLIWEPRYKISVILDQVLTPYNIGSIMRIVDNFGFSEIIHSTKGLSIDNSRLKRAAMGTENWIPIKYIEDLPLYLKAFDYPLIALEKTNNSLSLNKWPIRKPPFGIIIGNEAYGISENILSLCLETVHIPMKGFKNSMNLSHAFAIFANYISNLY